MHLLDPVRQAIKTGTSEEIEALIGAYEQQCDLARATWGITRYPEWEKLCSFWRGKLEDDLRRLKNAPLDPQTIGKLQGRIEVYDLMLRTQEALENDGKESKKGVELLRETLKVAQNRAQSGGDPDIDKLVRDESEFRRRKTRSLNGE